ncbi:MAG: hypothetical protein LBR56_09470, partial [Sporomusaceae bacterium]|nr:hypothetical protein [Sporomusaceae bacterium]
MKLTGKMICYFLVVVMVSSIGFGFIIQDSRGTKTDITNAKEQDIRRLAAANEIVQNSWIEVANVRGFIILRDEKLVERYKQASDENAAITKTMLAGARDETGRKFMQDIIDLDNGYSAIVEQRVLPLVRAGRIDEAITANIEAAAYAARLIEAVGKIKE